MERERPMMGTVAHGIAKSIPGFVVLLLLLQTVARESFQEGELYGIPERADVVKKTQESEKKEDRKERRPEVRENQEDTDPVFYDSTTSPKEMEQKDAQDL